MKRLGICIGLLLVGVCSAAARAQDTWAERLGYPAGKRVLILAVDDLGTAYEFNRPAQQAIQTGSVQSANVVVPGPWFPETAAWRKQHPTLDVGVALSLVSPSSVLRWGPVCSRSEVPSLVTADGYLAKSVLQFAVRADAQDVRQEAECQIRRARAAGLEPTHLFPHLGCMLTRADLMEVYLDLAEKYWIPAVMVELTPSMVTKFQEEGFALDDETVTLVGEYRLPKLDYVDNIPDAETYAEKRENFLQKVRSLPPGITELFLTPADNTPALKQMSQRWQNRVWEARLLTDPDVREFLKTEGVLFTNWREMMARFEGVETTRAKRHQASANATEK